MLELFQLRLVDQPDVILVIQVPADGTALARVGSLLARAVGPASGAPESAGGCGTDRA
jgi:hypothetical protein